MADLDEPDASDVGDPEFGPLPTGDLDELTDEERDALNDADAPEEEEFDLTPLFLEWVEEHLAVVEYTHSDRNTAAWCPEWWKHPEAVERLWASFEARQQARIDAAERADALSDWWLTHWDRHAAILFDAKAGPFRRCDRNLGHLHDSNGQEEQRVAYYAPPEGWLRA
ncbi:DUF4913 domain-containing protein (plasmid) [Curtobacterium sp. MCBD17_035]|uniref:DUF4913 domain-containing protein n=1 Tax=Curtobacterium sp. MCBD17_035 TaxID=2175673 RepID=UPI000DA6F5F0|nr:DUF4913 domain-containing protein [Curtobacterium sp. MCBD17_035]WIB69137.1 DUF4913 domain-containing protein [Curtobacterium sp. MCBD17_035]